MTATRRESLKLTPGDSIFGPIYAYDWLFESAKLPPESLEAIICQSGLTVDKVLDLAMEVKLLVGDQVLKSAWVNQMQRFRWGALPGTALFVAQGTEVVFGCSSNSGLCTVSFEKLS